MMDLIAAVGLSLPTKVPPAWAFPTSASQGFRVLGGLHPIHQFESELAVHDNLSWNHGSHSS